MEHTGEAPCLMRFGVFELDCRSGDLRKSGIRMKLHEQPFRILKVLLDRAGEVVTRDELRRAVWPDGDTFVDFDHGLNSAVNKLREVLGDSAGSPRFIETVPRRGYRFVAPVEPLAPEPPPPRVPEAAHVPPARRHSRVWIAGAVAVAAGVLVVGGWLKMRPSSEPAVPALTPLTAYTGSESGPTFSPDGNQVAFVWDGPAGGNEDIYVKLVKGEEPLRLTHNPGADFGPAWSPDGQWIAFGRAERRASGGSDAFRNVTIFLIPPVGGPERRVAEVKVPNPGHKFMEWLPDSRTLVVLDRSESGRSGIWSLSIQTRMKRQLTDPPEGVVADIDPAVSPDGRSIAFSRYRSLGLAEIYTIPLSGDVQPAGPAIPITNEGRVSHAPVWTADGRSIVFASGPQHRPSLWRVDAGGLTKPRSIYHPEKRVTQPAISHTRSRLAFSSTECDVSVRKLPLLGGPADPKGGEPFKILESTHIDHQAQYSPDGKQVVFGSNRSGYQEVWLSDGEGHSATQITKFDGAEVTFPYWSPDSKKLAFRVDGGSESGLYVMNVDGSGLRRILDTPSFGRWSQDGKWIYYSVKSGQSRQIWKIPVVEGAAQPVQITEAGDFAAESPDGKFLYYAITGDPGELWRMSTSGSEKRLVASPASDNFVPVANGVFYTPQVSAKTSIAFWNAATGTTSTVATPDNIVYWGLDVSPDGKYLLYVQLERFSRDLMLMEPFR